MRRFSIVLALLLGLSAAQADITLKAWFSQQLAGDPLGNWTGRSEWLTYNVTFVAPATGTGDAGFQYNVLNQAGWSYFNNSQGVAFANGKWTSTGTSQLVRTIQFNFNFNPMASNPGGVPFKARMVNYSSGAVIAGPTAGETVKSQNVGNKDVAQPATDPIITFSETCSPQLAPRKIDFFLNITNHKPKLHSVKITIQAVGGDVSSGPHIVAPAETIRRPAVNGKEAYDELIPTFTVQTVTMTEPAHGVWGGRPVVIFTYEGTAQTVQINPASGTISVLNDFWYNPFEYKHTLGTGGPQIPTTPPAPPATDTETPGTPKPPLTPPVPPNPSGEPLPVPTGTATGPHNSNTTPRPALPGLPTGEGNTMTPGDFYAGVRNALKDEGDSSILPGIGNTAPSDLNTGTDSRGRLDDIQGQMDNALYDTQVSKSKLSTKITGMAGTSWVPTTLGQKWTFDMATATVVPGKTLNVRIDLQTWSGTIAVIRACLLFALAVFFTIICFKTVRAYV